MQEYSARVLSKTYLTADVLTLDLKVGDSSFTFLPGQFVQFKIGELYRAYSIISFASDLPKVSFLIELIEGGVGSEYIRNLKVGDTVMFRGALGLFTPKETDAHHFFIATGVGIAPFRPIIKFLSEKPNQEIVLLFGGRVAERLWFRDEFKNIPNLNYVDTITRAGPAWTGLRGRVTEHLPKLYKGHEAAVFHVCGGKEMVIDVRSQLIALGHNPRSIKLEIFT